MPEWVDEDRFMNGLEYLGKIGVGKGWMVSYHHMCRWNSGWFYREGALEGVEWYWRVEPDVRLPYVPRSPFSDLCAGAFETKAKARKLMRRLRWPGPLLLRHRLRRLPLHARQ